MFTTEQHIDDIIAHVDRVRSNARILAAALIADGRAEFARVLLAKAHSHDASKWAGIEWMYMHQGPDVDKDMLRAAVAQHQKTNDHHPEFWGGVDNMPEVCVAEMVVDWLARSQEFASDLRTYVKMEATERYGLHKAPQQKAWIEKFIDMLLPGKFAKL